MSQSDGDSPGLDRSPNAFGSGVWIGLGRLMIQRRRGARVVGRWPDPRGRPSARHRLVHLCLQTRAQPAELGPVANHVQLTHLPWRHPRPRATDPTATDRPAAWRHADRLHPPVLIAGDPQRMGQMQPGAALGCSTHRCTSCSNSALRVWGSQADTRAVHSNTATWTAFLSAFGSLRRSRPLPVVGRDQRPRANGTLAR